MENCWFTGTRDCQQIASKVDVRFFWGKKLALGNVTEISENCMCINTHYCFPLNSSIELLVPFKKNILTIPVRVGSYRHTDSLHDTMYVEVLNPDRKYLEFASSFRKRTHKRISVQLDANLTYDGMNCSAVITNVSDGGLHTLFTPANSSFDYAPKKKVSVTFHTASGQTMSLHCMEKWARPVTNNESTISMGLEIIKPPSQYNEFLKILQ